MKRDYSKLPEHLPTGKLAFNDSTNELFIGAGENAPLQKVTDMDIHDELNQASIDYSGEHHENLKDSMDANVDFIMGEFNSTQMTGEFITAQNTLPRHIKRAELRGHTEVNLIQESSGEDLVLPYEFEDTQSLTLEDTKESGAVNVVLKGNTEVNVLKNPMKDYVVPYEFEEGYTATLTDTKETGSIKSAILSGQTLVNLFNINDVKYYNNDKDHYIENGYIVLPVVNKRYNHIKIPKEKCSMFKPSTKYTLWVHMLENHTEDNGDGTTQQNGSFWLQSYDYSESIVKSSNNGFYGCRFENNETGIKSCVFETHDLETMATKTQGINFDLPCYYAKTGGIQKLAIVILEGEYSIDELPFNATFEGMKSVKMPVLTTSNEDGTKTNILTVNEEVELRGVGDVKDELNLLTGELIENFETFTFNGSEDWRLQDDSLENTTRFILLNYAPNKVNNQKIGITNTYEWGFFDEDKPGIIITNPSGHVYLRTSKMSVDELKTMLSNNPIHGYYNKEKSIKTVDLTVQDQDGLSVPALSTYNEVTYLSTSSAEGSLRPKVSSKIPEFPVMIKPNTKYSIVADTTENGHEAVPLTYNLGGAEIETEIGNKVTVIQTPSTLTNETFKVTGTGMKLSNVMILEKDLTGKEIPNYTEGMNSVKVSEITSYQYPYRNHLVNPDISKTENKFPGSEIDGDWNIFTWNLGDYKVLSKPTLYKSTSHGNDIFYVKFNIVRLLDVPCNSRIVCGRIGGYDQTFMSGTEYDALPLNQETTFSFRGINSVPTTDHRDISLCFGYHSREIEMKFKVRNVIFVNLTKEYGIGNEPTKEWCDANIKFAKDNELHYTNSSKVIFPEVELNGLGEGSNRVEDTFNPQTGLIERNVLCETFVRSNPIFTNSKTAYHQNSDTHCGFDLLINPEHHHDRYRLYSDFFVYGSGTDRNKCYITSHQGQTFVCRVPKKPNGDNLTLDEFHALLEKHQPKVAFILEKPIKEEIDVNGSLKTWNTKTHFNTTVPNGALNPIISSKPLEYEVLLKPNTQYSIITNPISNGHTNSPISFDLGGQQVGTTVGSYCTLVTTPSTLTHDKLVMKGKGNKLSGGVMIFEGDKTGMSFAHFDGMKSVENPTVRVFNSNLISYKDILKANPKAELVEVDGELWIDCKNTNIYGKVRVFCNPGESYYLRYSGKSDDNNWGIRPVIHYSDGTVTHCNYSGDGRAVIAKSTVGKTIKYLSFDVPWHHQNKNTKLHIPSLYFSKDLINVDDIIPHKENSTSLTIPMRSLPNGVCDTLNLITGEYVQNVMKITLNGNETWYNYALKEEYPDVIGFYAYLDQWGGRKGTSYLYYGSLPPTTTDPFPGNLTKNEELITVSQVQFVKLALFRNKLQTLDISGLNTWLSENPIHLQYQLSKPIVTKLDLAWEDGKLFAYDGTTHFFVDVDGGHLQPVLDIDVPVNIVAELSRLRAEKEQLESYNGQLENQLSLLSLRNSDLQSNVQSLVAENSQLKLSTQDLQTRSNVLQLKNKELKQHQEKLQAENVELKERASQLTQATENLTDGLHTVDAVRESGDLELLSSDFDLDFRLMEIEFALDIPMSLFKGVKTMARTPYEMAKTLILGGKYDRADMEYKLGRYLERKQLTQEQYDELMALIEATDLVG